MRFAVPVVGILTAVFPWLEQLNLPRTASRYDASGAEEVKQAIVAFIYTCKDSRFS